MIGSVFLKTKKDIPQGLSFHTQLTFVLSFRFATKHTGGVLDKQQKYILVC